MHTERTLARHFPSARPSARTIVLIAAFCALAAVAVPSLIAMATDEPAFTLEKKDGQFEIRRYAPLLAAEVTVTGERSAAINAGFRLLADYIFGNNTAHRKIDMTIPVTQQQSETIAMTAPVTQQSAGDAWKVRFMMPASFTAETLPVPNDARVTIIAVPETRVAAVRFSGWSSEANLAEHRALLEGWIQAQRLKPAGTPIAAFYNPPWSLPFLRRNEFLIELAD